MRVYIFGNPLVQEDSAALSLRIGLMEKFPEVEFVTADPNDNFPPPGEKNPVILDAVKGIPRTMLLDFSDLASVEKSPVSPHDYDLLLHLLLLKKMAKIETVKIIGIPYGSTAPGLRKEIEAIISSLL